MQYKIDQIKIENETIYNINKLFFDRIQDFKFYNKKINYFLNEIKENKIILSKNHINVIEKMDELILINNINYYFKILKNCNFLIEYFNDFDKDEKKFKYENIKYSYIEDNKNILTKTKITKQNYYKEINNLLKIDEKSNFKLNTYKHEINSIFKNVWLNPNYKEYRNQELEIEKKLEIIYLFIKEY